MKTSPAFFHHDHPFEELMKDVNDVVVGSNSMSFDDYIEATLWKWFMISLHFLGWLRFLSIDLKKHYGISHREFYTKLFDWIMSNHQTILYKEYLITKRLLKKVFDRKIPWGRKVSDVSSIYWEYEEATAIHIAKNKTQFYNDIEDFIEEHYDIDFKIIKNQYDKMKDPYKHYNGDLEKWARECMWWGRRADRFFVDNK